MKEAQIWTRLDPKLKEQLQRYADRHDEGVVSRTTRRAIEMFINEQKDI